MRLDDISIAYKRAKAEQIVTNLEQPINLHLLKLLGCEADETMRAHWKHELGTWLIRIAAIKIKPQNYSIPARTVFEWLYNETFGGSEVHNVEVMLWILARDYPRNQVPPKTIAGQLRAIHERLAQKLSENDSGEDIIADI